MFRILKIIVVLMISSNVFGQDINTLIPPKKPEVNLSIQCSMAMSLAIEDYLEYVNKTENGVDLMEKSFESIFCSSKTKEIVVVFLPKNQVDEFLMGGDIIYTFDKIDLSLIKRKFGR